MIGIDDGEDGLLHVPEFVSPETSRKSNSTALPSGDNLPTIRGRFFPLSQ